MRKIEDSEYKGVALNVLLKIDSICREHNITYMLTAGTLLGAVRHKGFIPWDDDIDIMLKRSEYNMLMKVVEGNDYGLNFISIENSRDTIYPFGKVCDTSTVLYEHNFKKVNNLGVFVDIFPLDYIPNDDREKAKLHNRTLRQVKTITHSSRTGYKKAQSHITNIKRFAAFKLGKMCDTQKLIAKVYADSQRYNGSPTNYLGVPWSGIYPADYVTETKRIMFENHELSAPINADGVLKILYGDYMKLPAESERICKHDFECYYIE